MKSAFDDATMRSMQTARPRMNFDQLQRMPSDGRRYELHDGVLHELAAPHPRHQRVAQHIQEVLLAYERAVGGLVLLSPIDIVLSLYDVVQPDVVFLTSEQAARIDMRQPVRLAPALCVEVLSDTTESVDRGWKLRTLARFSVQEFWLVDAEDHTIERYVLNAGVFVLDTVASGHDTMTSSALPGLSFAVDQVFLR